jgi:hypothetical protein
VELTFLAGRFDWSLGVILGALAEAIEPVEVVGMLHTGSRVDEVSNDLVSSNRNFLEKRVFSVFSKFIERQLTGPH